MKRLAVIACVAVLLLAGCLHAEEMRIIIAVKGKNLHAVLEDNPASRALYAQMPFTVSMRNLYQREFGFTLPARLPTDKLIANNYRVGDIIYMPHRNSVSVLYRQNGERFRRQHLGHIESGAEIFGNMKDSEITFVPDAE